MAMATATVMATATATAGYCGHGSNLLGGGSDGARSRAGGGLAHALRGRAAVQVLLRVCKRRLHTTTTTTTTTTTITTTTTAATAAAAAAAAAAATAAAATATTIPPPPSPSPRCVATCPSTLVSSSPSRACSSARPSPPYGREVPHLHPHNHRHHDHRLVLERTAYRPVDVGG